MPEARFPEAEVFVVTEAEFLEARARSCAEVGLTWDELLAKRRPCGCCFDGPDIYRRIWFVYHHATEEPDA